MIFMKGEHFAIGVEGIGFSVAYVLVSSLITYYFVKRYPVSRCEDSLLHSTLQIINKSINIANITSFQNQETSTAVR